MPVEAFEGNNLIFVDEGHKGSGGEAWLVEHGDKVKMVPPGLNKSESQFVRDMKDYWAKEKDKSLARYIIQKFLPWHQGHY